MVTLAFKNSSKRGRPKKTTNPLDKGTSEFQNKRRQLLKSLNLHKNVPNRTVFHAILDGCYLNRFYWLQYLTLRQLKTGLKVRKIYYQSLRSQGIKSRLSSLSGKLSPLRSRDDDPYESRFYEQKWYDLKDLITSPIPNKYYSQLILKIILNDSISNLDYDNMKRDLIFLQTLSHCLNYIELYA